MTDGEIVKVAEEHWSSMRHAEGWLWEFDKSDLLNFARVLLAAGASEGQASKYHDQEPDWENPAPMYFKEQTERTSPAPSVDDAHLPCPICKGVEGCDHTVPEHARAAQVADAVGASECPLSDEWIEMYALRHIAPHASGFKKAFGLDVPYQQTEQFERVKAYTQSVCAAIAKESGK